MRNATRAAVVVSSVSAALTMGSAVAQASTTPTVEISTPNPNTAVVSITNHRDESTSCGARLYGFSEYDTPYTTTAPQSTITFTMTNVPAGNYSVWWACNGYTGPRQMLSIGGDPQTSGKPQTAVSH